MPETTSSFGVFMRSWLRTDDVWASNLQEISKPTLSVDFSIQVLSSQSDGTGGLKIAGFDLSNLGIELVDAEALLYTYSTLDVPDSVSVELNRKPTAIDELELIAGIGYDLEMTLPFTKATFFDDEGDLDNI